MSIKDFIKELPLDDISEKVAEVVAWWSEQVKDIPVEELPLQVYVGGSAIACILWFFVARFLPRPLGGISWIILIAALFTPGNSIDDTGDVAPAIIGVMYSILMKDFQLAALKAMPILLVIIAGSFLGFVWQLIRDTIAQMETTAPTLKKTANQKAQSSKPSLASANNATTENSADTRTDNKVDNASVNKPTGSAPASSIDRFKSKWTDLQNNIKNKTNNIKNTINNKFKK